MGEVNMNVKLLAHTQLSDDYWQSLEWDYGASDGQVVALSAIRCCYSANKPSEIVAKEGAKYFGTNASDGEGGTDADRLIRQIMRSKHLSTVEHITFTFAIEGVSRALLAQLTRHRVGFSFSVQSQRYVKFGSGDRSGGFDYVIPDKIRDNDYARREFELAMVDVQNVYDELRTLGVPAEDARAVLPNAAACNLVMTANLRSLLDFYAKRKAGRGAQGEITQLAERLREEVEKVEGWTKRFFDEV